MTETFFQALLPFATNDFQKELLEAAFQNLDDKSNKLRFNNFACGIRELSRHVLARLAPDEDVRNCSWYENLTQIENGITRAQRVKYAIQGGLEASYLQEIIEIDHDHAQLVSKAINLLNKYTHVNEESFNINSDKIIELVSGVTQTFSNFIRAIADCRTGLMQALEKDLDEKFLSDAINESMDSIADLASHFSLEGMEATNYKVIELKSDYLVVEVTGTVDVILQFGSNSDLRNDLGLEVPENFPFNGQLFLYFDEGYPNGEAELESFYVDTSSWDFEPED